MSITKYFSEAVTELHRVTWPTHAQATRIVIVVLVSVIASAAAFGLLDALLAAGYAWLISFAQTFSF